MKETVKLTLPEGKDVELPILTGTENQKSIDISKLRAQTGYTTFDLGYANTCPSTSKITFLNGEQGILRYRGYEISDVCDKHNFFSVMYLLLNGNFPNQEQLNLFIDKLYLHSTLPQELIDSLKALPKDSHPMVIVSTAINNLSAFYPECTKQQDDEAIYIALGKILPIIGYAYCHTNNKPFSYGNKNESYAKGLLQIMFGNSFNITPEIEEILDNIFILHADHEFNCSTSTVRLVGSSQTNLFASLAAGINALWGPLHGGANQKVLEMLQQIEKDDDDIHKFLEKVKDKSNSTRLMGFGHRVYKNYDPRAKIIKKTCNMVLQQIGTKDPLLKIAQELESAALQDEYFTKRKLYPNVDFYSGIVYRALNIPTNLFTPLFVLGRFPGWIAHWKEQNNDSSKRIGRPRQLYQGQTNRKISD